MTASIRRGGAGETCKALFLATLPGGWVLPVRAGRLVGHGAELDVTPRQSMPSRAHAPKRPRWGRCCTDVASATAMLRGQSRLDETVFRFRGRRKYRYKLPSAIKAQL